MEKGVNNVARRHCIQVEVHLIQSEAQVTLPVYIQKHALQGHKNKLNYSYWDLIPSILLSRPPVPSRLSVRVTGHEYDMIWEPEMRHCFEHT